MVQVALEGKGGADSFLLKGLMLRQMLGTVWYCDDSQASTTDLQNLVACSGLELAASRSKKATINPACPSVSLNAIQ